MSEKFNPMGGAVRKSLHVVVLADVSGSMMGPRIESLNTCMRDVMPMLRTVASENAECDMYMSIMEFSTGAVWKDSMVKLDEYGAWEDFDAGGVTELGAALKLLSTKMNSDPMPEGLGTRNAPPLIILVTDGLPTDDWEAGMKAFEATGFGSKSRRTVRVAIGVKEAEMSVLERFTGNPELVFDVTNATSLANVIQWATVTLSQSVSEGRSSDQAGAAEPELVLPEGPQLVDDDADDGFTF